MLADLSKWSLPDWASIASLLIVIYTAIQIRNVKRNMMVSLTVSEILIRLRHYSGRLNGFLMTYSVCVDDFDEVVGLCHADVLAVRRRFGFHRSRFCRDLLRSIKLYHATKSAEAGRAVYNALQQVVQEIANRVEERRIMGP